MCSHTINEGRIRRSERKLRFICKTGTDDAVKGICGMSDRGRCEGAGVNAGKRSQSVSVLSPIKLLIFWSD